MGLFVLSRNASKKVRFSLKAANGATIASSIWYKSLNKCKENIEKLKKEVNYAMLEDQTIRGFSLASAPKFELFKNEKGEFLFNLIGSDGEILIKSETYTVKASCKNGIASVIKNALIAVITE